jgi:hypothetical protein
MPALIERSFDSDREENRFTPRKDLWPAMVSFPDPPRCGSQEPPIAGTRISPEDPEKMMQSFLIQLPP